MCLTAAATVLAMIPLARSVFWGPMAIAIMGGLTVATLLTIFFVPALYAAWFKVNAPLRRCRPRARSGLMNLAGRLTWSISVMERAGDFGRRPVGVADPAELENVLDYLESLR